MDVHLLSESVNVRWSDTVEGRIAVFSEPHLSFFIKVECDLSIVETLLDLFEPQVDDGSERRLGQLVEDNLRINSRVNTKPDGKDTDSGIRGDRIVGQVRGLGF